MDEEEIEEIVINPKVKLVLDNNGYELREAFGGVWGEKTSVYLIKKDNDYYIAKPHYSVSKGLNTWKEVIEVYMICENIGVGPKVKEYLSIDGGSGIVIMEVGYNTYANYMTARNQRNSEVEKIISKLHDHRMLHGDMHAKNIMMRKDGTAFLIDLDSTVNVDTGRLNIIKSIYASYNFKYGVDSIDKLMEYEKENYYEVY